MQQDHSKAIKGLSIAAIILGALAIIAFLIGWVVLAFVNSMYDAFSYDITNNYGYYDDYYYDYGYGYDFPGTSYESEAFAYWLVNLIYGACATWGIACSIFVIVVGIIGVVNAKKPEKLGLVFGWSIAGAIIGFLGMGWIPTILFIIVAVFAQKDKNLYAAGYYPATQDAAYAQPVAVPLQNPAENNAIPTASEGIVAEPSPTVQIEAMEAADAAKAEDPSAPGTPQA